MPGGNADIARLAFDRFNRGNVGGWIELWTEDCEWTTLAEGAGEPEPYRGHEGLRQYHRDLFDTWERFQVHGEHFRNLGDEIVVIGRVTATGRDGVELRMPSGWHLHFRDGRIARGRANHDPEEAIRMGSDTPVRPAHAAHAAFRHAVEAGDAAAAIATLADDVVFRSPAVFKPYEGREAAGVLLGAVVEVFEDFRYVDEIAGHETTALVFKARVGDRELDGIDLLRFDGDGLISEFTVMIRPLSGLQALATAMAELLG